MNGSIKITELLEEGKTEMAVKVNEKWKHVSPFGMTYFTRKERQTNGSLFEKTAWKAKSIVALKIVSLSIYYFTSTQPN